MSDRDREFEQELDQLYQKLAQDAEAGGYHLNPDRELTMDLVRGLLTNMKRYGYMACPCRLAEGNKQEDLDIICPCDYRDPDLEDYGTCYCGLYVSREVVEGKKSIGSIPERRAVAPSKRPQFQAKSATEDGSSFSGDMKLKYPVWRCKVCGYLCAREKPPLECPVCKADKERFERFL